LARLAQLLFLTLSVIAISPSLRAQLINVQLLGNSLTAPVTDLLSNVDLLNEEAGGLGVLLEVDVLGDNGLLGVSVSGQDILLLGAPVADDPTGSVLAPLMDLGGSQGAVLEFLQDTASDGDINPTVLTVVLPGSGDASNGGIDNSKDKVTKPASDSAEELPKDSGYRCVDNDRDNVCDSHDQCLDSAPHAIVLPSGCHLDAKTPLALRDVTFAVDTALLTASSTATLRQAAKMLKANQNLQIEIGGHTDDLGSENYNQRLSERRAVAVKKYFLAEGVPESMLSVRGYGESRPVVATDSLEGNELLAARTRNRRVELRVLKGDPKPSE